MRDLPLKQLRKYRSYTTEIVRGTMPEVKFAQNHLTEKIILSIFIFVFSSIIIGGALAFFLDFIALAALGFQLGLVIAVSLVCLFLFWPAFYVTYLHLSSGKKPPEEILGRFGDRYKNLKQRMLKNGFVAPSPGPTKAEASKPKLTKKSSFRLWLGSSSGKLIDLWHKSGIAKNQQVVLGEKDACQNILVLGGIGSGKTTCVMQPILLQCLDQKCGGLIFDIKGDVKHAVAQFAAATGRKLVLLGPGHCKINLLAGLTPEVAASFLKSAFLLNGKGNSDSFWVDTATELCRNTLGILSFLPQHYSLQELYQYLFDPNTRDSVDEAANALLETLEEPQRRLLKAYRRYHETIFAQFDQKIKSGVNATIAQALSPFTHPNLLDAFCSTGDSIVKMEDLLTGSVYMVDLPLSIWGLGGKVAYTFIKLRFFNLMQNRNQMESTFKTPVFFMCDEYQEIVSANHEGLSDLNFWDKSRSSKTVGIISSQSIASFYAALGNHDVSNALLQNFRQKLCLRTEDPTTLRFMENLIGRARVKKLSVTEGANAHYSNTISDAREGVVDAQLFRELDPNQAVAILSLAGQSMDDVLTLIPVYVD